MEVPSIIALEMPCMTLKKIRKASDGDKTQPSDEAARNIMPSINILFRPYWSARRPNGRRKAAVAIRKPETTQFSMLWLAPNSNPIAGITRLIALTIKGVMKEVIMTTTIVIAVRPSLISVIFLYPPSQLSIKH